MEVWASFSTNSLSGPHSTFACGPTANNITPTYMSNTSVAVIAVNLVTGERNRFPSIRRAGVYCMVDTNTVRHSLELDISCHAWYWCRATDIDTKEEKIQQLIRRWRAENPDMPSPRTRPDLLPLRIDAHTVIYVTKDKHNERYAEQYREKLKKNKSKIS